MGSHAVTDQVAVCCSLDFN